MVKYISSQVAFVAVGGNKGAGKSLFCDKILNLAEIKGNHVALL
jgi:uridine kinase